MTEQSDPRQTFTFEASELQWAPGTFRKAMVVENDTVVLTKIMRDREGDVESWRFENPRKVVTVFND